MANKKVILVTLLALCATSVFSQISQGLISVGAHKNGVSVGEPVVYNKGRANIGFLNRFKGSSFTADFYLSNDTLCQNDLTQIVLQDSSFLACSCR